MLWRIDTFQPGHNPPDKPNPSDKRAFSTSTKKGGERPKTKPKQKTQVICLKCKQDHPMWKCPNFLSLLVKDRLKYVNDSGIRKVCLTHNTSVPCRSTYRCTTCKEAHTSLLHDQDIRSFFTSLPKNVYFPQRKLKYIPNT